MANKVKIYSELGSATIFFEGSKVSSKELNSVEAVAHPTLSNRIRIKSTKLFKRANSSNRRVFFRKLKMDRIQDKDGNQLDGSIYNYNRDQIIDYLNGEFAKTIPLSAVGEYKGAYDAATNTPDFSATSPNNGDYYRVTNAGTQNGVDYVVNDEIWYSSSANGGAGAWQINPFQGVRVDTITSSALSQYDIHVDADYTGSTTTGSSVYPYNDLATAVAASSAGDRILLKGTFELSSTLTLPHGLSFKGVSCVIKFSSYGAVSGDLINFSDSTPTDEIEFEDVQFQNASGYALDIDKAKSVKIRRCVFKNNGFSGNRLNTVIGQTGTWASGGTLGYDSSQADLQSFYASSEASNGGGLRIKNTPVVSAVENESYGNLRSLRFQDCGIGGYGYVTRNQCYNNIESGIYLASGAYDATGGCENFTVYNNACKYNANNGILSIGGNNNVISLNVLEGNWNAGAMLWHASNATLRDVDLSDNNRSEFNGIGNRGDAHASVTIGGNTTRDDRDFIANVLGVEIKNTGLGSNTARYGLQILEDVQEITDDYDKALINIDNVGFLNQDYSLDVLCDLDIVKLTVGNNRYIGSAEKDVNTVSGYYYEIPFSNHVTSVKNLNVSLDSTTSNVILKEGVAGNVINPYNINTLQAIAFGSKIRIILKNTNKIQVEVAVANTSINGSMVNSVLNQALVQLNNIFTNTAGFASGGGNPVTNFELVSDDLTLTLEDGTSYTVDVTTLGVDSNNFVVSGEVVGSDLVLTMTDSSTVTIDAQNMINGSSLSALGQNWFISYGANAGTQLGNPTSGNLSFNNAPIYYGEKLEVGTEFMWTQYHLVNNAASYMSIGVWAGATNDVTGGSSTAVTNWSTKIGFFYNTLTEDTATLVNGGYSSKNTNIGSGVTYTNGAIMRLVYGTDYKLKLYANDTLIATTIVAESGNDLDIQLIASNNGVEFPNFIKRTTNWTIAHDLDNSENNDILNGIEEDTVLETNFEIGTGEKAMINLSGFGRNHRIGLDYTGASSGNNNPVADMETPIVYGTSEQIIPQSPGEWSFNTSAVYYSNVGNGKWNVPSANAGMISIRYYNDNSIDLYSETYGEVIATRLTNLDGTPFKVSIAANENVANFNDLPTLSKQVIGQGFQPVTTFAPDISNQSFDITEDLAFSVQIALDADSDIVNQYVISSDDWSFVMIDQNTGVLSGTAPPLTGSDSYEIYCKAGNAVGGITNFIVTLNVVAPTYTNTKSLKFDDGDSSWLGGNAANVTALERASNGTGSADGWTIAFWYKRGTASSGQTLFYFGNSNISNQGYIEVKNISSSSLRLIYGSNNNRLQLVTPSGTLNNGWNHIMITYDGGTTGTASGSLSDYYSRFKIIVNSVQKSTTNSNANYGYNGSIVGQNFRFGKLLSGNYIKDGRLNQLVIWNSDQSSNAVGLYNNGDTQDISLLAAGVGNMNTNYLEPDHYYEVNNSTTSIQDLIGTAHLVGYNFSNSDLIDDAP